MNRIVFLLIINLCFLGLNKVQAQSDFVFIKNTTSLQANLATSNSATNTISSDFTQIKNMKMMDEKVKSKGEFYYKKDNKIRIEYTAPYKYLLIMNGAGIIVKDENKTSRISTRNSKSLQSANKIMMECMTGSVFNNKDFQINSFENGSLYLLQLTPVVSSMKSLFSRIDIFIEKSDYSVSKLVMNEANGDYTQMNFTNRKKNLPLSDALFINP